MILIYKRIIFLVILNCCLVSLFGCGFKLRGQIDVPASLKEMYIAPCDPYEPFQQLLRARLRANKVIVLNRPKDGVTILEITAPQVSETPLAFGSSGEMQRLTLAMSIRYKLISADKDREIEERTITRSRELNVSINELLSNENQNLIVRRELMNELVSELLRQITTRPFNKPIVLDSSQVNNNPC